LQQAGDTAPVVTTANGFSIVRLLERRPAGTRPFTEVREVIRYELLLQKRREREEAFFAEMKRGLPIVVNEAVLDTVAPPASASQSLPPPLPRGG
jgi:parvulin-like peptidyl-prolyl isomerase